MRVNGYRSDVTFEEIASKRRNEAIEMLVGKYAVGAYDNPNSTPKDPEAKTHPCMVPYECLPWEQRVKDYLFISVSKALLRMAQNKTVTDADVAEVVGYLRTRNPTRAICLDVASMI